MSLIECQNCTHLIPKGKAKWCNETQEVLCPNCYEDEMYYQEHPEEYELDDNLCDNSESP